jgi:predicted nucleic-acid-binding protein
VLLRYILCDIPEQYDEAAELLDRKGVVFHVADMVFVEVADVLRRLYEHDKVAVVKYLRLILDMKNVNCNKVMLRVAIDNYEKYPKLSFADCCIAEYARLNEAEPVWTFDRKFARQNGVAKLLGG